MQLVRARLQGRVEDRAARTAVLRAERARQDSDLVDGVDRGFYDIGDAAEEVDIARVVVDAVEQVVVLRRPHAVGREHERGARALLRWQHADREAGENRIVASVDRQASDHGGGDRRADRAAAGLEQRGVARHHDVFSDGARLELKIDGCLLLNVNGDAATRAFPESREFDFDQVVARAYRRKDVGAVGLCHAGQREALPFVTDRHRRAWKHASRRVSHCAANRACVDLGERWRRQQH